METIIKDKMCKLKKAKNKNMIKKKKKKDEQKLNMLIAIKMCAILKIMFRDQFETNKFL